MSIFTSSRGFQRAENQSHRCSARKVYGSNAYYRPHSHPGLTTHLIVSGDMTIAFPADPVLPEKKKYGVGERVDVEAGRVHEVWIGSEGCTYVIGE